MAFSAVCFSFMPVFVKLAYAGGVNLVTLLAARFALAAIVVWPAIFFTGQLSRVGIKDMGAYLLLSLVGYGGASTCYFAALQRIPASLAAMLFYAYPLFVVLWEMLFYRARPGAEKLAALALAVAGLLLVLGKGSGEASAIGLLLGAGSAVCYAAYFVFGRRLLRQRSPLAATGFVLLLAAAGFWLYGGISGQLLLDLPVRAWAWVVALAVISTAVAILALFAGLKRVDAGTAAITSALEPALAVILAAAVFAEPLTFGQAAGIMLVLGGVVVLQLPRSPSSSLPDTRR